MNFPHPAPATAARVWGVLGKCLAANAHPAITRHPTAFHHAVEAYKVADLLAENNICAAMWADWGGFKHEAYDMVQANVAIVDQAKNGERGGRAGLPCS